MKMKKHSKGLSLVEMMIAIVISLLLGAAMITLFISNKKAYTESERFARMQDNGRHAIHVLTEELRLVDFWGEAHASDIEKHTSITGLSISPDCISTPDDAAVMKYEKALWSINSGVTSSNISGLNCIAQGDVLEKTDVLALKHASGSTSVISDNNTYLITNPQRAILFHKTSANTAPTTTSPGGDVPGGAIRKYIYNIYYINNSNPVPSLDRKTLSGSTLINEPIADGVENFRVLFGIDTDIPADNEVDSFVPSANVTNWSKVIAVRIYLLIRSAEQDRSYTDNKTYKLGDVTVVNPNDNFHRTVVSSTVTLRNPQIVLKGGF